MGKADLALEDGPVWICNAHARLESKEGETGEGELDYVYSKGNEIESKRWLTVRSGGVEAR